MLLNYKCTNFGPFKDTAELSMKPGKVTDRFKDNVHETKSGLKVSKIAVIVGENAGGKTNFIKSLDFLKFLLFDSRGGTGSLKHSFNNYSKDGVLSFEISIVENDVIYDYLLKVNKYFITEESLSIKNSRNISCEGRNIFRIKIKKIGNLDRDSMRNLNDISREKAYDIYTDERIISEELNKILQEEKINIFNNMLLIRYLSNMNINEIKPFTNFMDKKLNISLPEEAGYNLYLHIEKSEKDKEILKKENFIDIFSLVDSSIKEIKVDEEEPYRKTKIIRENSSGDKFEINLENDSSGVREFFALAIQIWRVVNENAVVFADEMDRVLNSVLATKVINYIKGSEHKGQFVFSTHNILHLNTNIFMKEQIYFATKDPDTLNSELYSLADFTDYRYSNPKVYEIYLKGLLGGVPND